MANSDIAKTIRDALFDLDLFGEEITYNGKKVVANCEVGEAERQKSPAFMRISNATEVSGDAKFTVNTNDVPEPKRGDEIVYKGIKYFVGGVLLLDSIGGNVTVKATYKERGYVRR